MNHEELTIDQIKEKLAAYLLMMPVYYKDYFKEDHLIKQSKSIEYQVIPQNGFIYFESKDATHFVVPTNILCKTIQPPEYFHKVIVYNTRTNLFDTLCTGVTNACLQYIWDWQERRYGFSLKNRNNALTWLKQAQTFFEWTGELLPEEFNAQTQASVVSIMKKAKEELGITDEEDVSGDSIEEARRKASERAKLRKERKQAFEEERLKF